MTNVYVPQKLRDKLPLILESGLSLVQAGAGYGKTTLIKWTLAERQNVIWHVSAPDDDEGNYLKLCNLMAPYLHGGAEELLKLGFPNRANAKIHAAIWASVELQSELYLVLDNFESFLPRLPRSLLSMLVNHGSDKLHLIIVSRYLGKVSQLVVRPVLSFCQEELCWTREDMLELFCEYGFPLQKKDLDWLMETSQGWGVMAWLSFQKTLEEGSFSRRERLGTLLNDLLWARLDAKEKELLAAAGFFEALTPPILGSLTDAEDLSEGMRLFLSGIPLMDKDTVNDIYRPHELLRQYLQDKLKSFSVKKQKKICFAAAKCYREMKDRQGQIYCYLSAGADEEALALPFNGLFMAKLGPKMSFEQACLHLSEHLTDEIMARHYLNMLYVAYSLFGYGHFEKHERLMERLKALASVTTAENALGEWTLIHCLGRYPDLEAMYQDLIQAALLLKKQSRVILKEEAFFFGCVSMWTIFHVKSGQMEASYGILKEFIEVYKLLTGGNGHGADTLYLCDYYCSTGDFEKALATVDQAVYEAKSSGQLSILIGAAVLRGTVGIYQNDELLISRSIETLENLGSEEAPLYSLEMRNCMIDTARSFLLGLMVETQKAPSWTREGEDLKMNLIFSNYIVYQPRVTDMVINREYQRAFALIEALLKGDKRYLSAGVLTFLYAGLALCAMGIRDFKRAAIELDRLLTLCVPDRNYALMARLRKMFLPLFRMESISASYAEAIKAVKALEVDYAGHDEEKIFNYLREPTEEDREILTPREQEIATLAAQGLRNSEIAQKLFLSEVTVKGYISSIFKKLQIDRRSKILEMLE